MARVKSFLVQLAERKRLERLQALIEELGGELEELEGLLKRLTITLGRLKLLLEIERGVEK